jgi:hypothetical protein
VTRLLYPILCSLLVLSCEKNSGEARTTTVTADTTHPAGVDSALYTGEWNMGEDPSYPEKSVDTRFVVRVNQFRSGILSVHLDTALVAEPGRRRHFFPADSVKVSGLTRIDHFTQACKNGSEKWAPRIGVLADTVYERDGRPRFIWVIDTATARIRPLPTDSASCFLAGPD